MAALSRLIICICLVALAGCGGRVARPVAVENSFDEKLSCAHVEAEFEVNKQKLIELGDERSDKTAYNIATVLWSPLFLDFSGSEKEEIEALHRRNNRLAELAKDKGCIAQGEAVEAS